MVMSVEGKPNQYIAALVDLWPGFTAELPEGKTSPDNVDHPLTFRGGEIVSAKLLTFKSPKDFIVDYPASSSRLRKVMIINDGYVPAHNISIGIALIESPESKCIIVPSPNIKISQDAIPPSGINPALVKVTIERLGASEKALLTVMTSPAHSANTARNESPYLTITDPLPGDSILYVSSDEGSGRILPQDKPWKDVMSWEQINFPTSQVGFWASRIHPKHGVVPLLEDMKGLEIEYELVDSTGKHTGNGSLILPSDK